MAIGVNHLPCNNKHNHVSSIHAEHSAILKLLKLNKYRRFLNPNDKIDIIVIRISKQGKLGYSRPCKGCIQHLTKLNNEIKINNVIYSDIDDTFKKEKLTSMLDSPLTKLSSGNSKRLKNNIKSNQTSNQTSNQKSNQTNKRTIHVKNHKKMKVKKIRR